MRFSAFTAALLPVIAASQQVYQQYEAPFQNVLGRIASYIPHPGRFDPVAALEAKTGAMKLHILTLDNWKHTLFEPVKPGAKTPEEWWILFSGGNKTCFGRCGGVETAFKETAAKFAVVPSSPHMAYVNCEDQPVLCNAWSAAAGTIWAVEMLPAPSTIDIYTKRLNLTSTTSEDLAALSKVDKMKSSEWTLLDSWFHPFNGKAAELGLAIPFGYLVWGFSAIPNWLFMITISMFSRRWMANRFPEQRQQQQQQQQRARPQQ